MWPASSYTVLGRLKRDTQKISNARHQIGCAHRRLQPSRNGHEQFVAHLMPIGVIDMLELV